MRIGLNASVCVDPHIMLISASLMKPKCLAIAISHTGRSTQPVMALKEAREHGADTMCISSYAGSPVTQYADITLITSPNSSKIIKEATLARIAHIALLDSLCTYIAMQNSEKRRGISKLYAGAFRTAEILTPRVF
jgi:DNA-binding MurR/RpiR family transcriptional regulator